jgi:hypothetical protein
VLPDLAIFDAGRMFALYGFRHGHSYALIRGFPDTDSESDGPDTVLDLAFENVSRVSCWRDFSPLSLRYATAAEKAELERRVGSLRSRQRAYLLQPDTTESYVIAARLTVAEFAIGGGFVSPLVAEDKDYIAEHPAIGGRQHY